MKKVAPLLFATAIFIAAVGILTQKDRFPELDERYAYCHRYYLDK